MNKEEEGVLWSFHQWLKGEIRGSPFFWKNSWAWCQFRKAIEFGVKVCGALKFRVFFFEISRLRGYGGRERILGLCLRIEIWGEWWWIFRWWWCWWSRLVPAEVLNAANTI
jgi:hypothetical protein